MSSHDRDACKIDLEAPQNAAGGFRVAIGCDCQRDSGSGEIAEKFARARQRPHAAEPVVKGLGMKAAADGRPR